MCSLSLTMLVIGKVSVWAMKRLNIYVPFATHESGDENDQHHEKQNDTNSNPDIDVWKKKSLKFKNKYAGFHVICGASFVVFEA